MKFRPQFCTEAAVEAQSRGAVTQLSFLTKTLGIAEEFSVKTTQGAICWTKHSSTLTHLRAPQDGADYFFGLNFTLFASLTSIFTNKNSCNYTRQYITGPVELGGHRGISSPPPPFRRFWAYYIETKSARTKELLLPLKEPKIFRPSIGNDITKTICIKRFNM